MWSFPTVETFLKSCQVLSPGGQDYVGAEVEAVDPRYDGGG